jgi:hypothetical protein
VTKREHDLTFDTTEKLWRRIGKKDIGGAVKGNKLRLQISVVRERYGKIESVPQGDRTGVAEAQASDMAVICKDAIKVVCVDDPNDEPGHALVALVVNPGDATSQDCINATRGMIAAKLSIVVPPK